MCMRVSLAPILLTSSGVRSASRCHTCGTGPIATQPCATSCTQGQQHSRSHKVDKTPICSDILFHSTVWALRDCPISSQKRLASAEPYRNITAVGRSGADTVVMVRTMFVNMTNGILTQIDPPRGKMARKRRGSHHTMASRVFGGFLASNSGFASKWIPNIDWHRCFGDDGKLLFVASRSRYEHWETDSIFLSVSLRV